jgi:hypothetical protein
MPAMFILAAGATGLVLAVLAVVVAGIRQEPAQELTRQPPRLMASLTRRLLGVSVRSPDPFVITDQQRGEPGQASGPARLPARTRPAQIWDI